MRLVLAVCALCTLGTAAETLTAEQQAQVDKTYGEIDRDPQDDYISVKELEAYFKLFGETVQPGDTEDWMNRADMDGDMLMHRDEYIGHLLHGEPDEQWTKKNQYAEKQGLYEAKEKRDAEEAAAAFAERSEL